jgi:hypothetical protein
MNIFRLYGPLNEQMTKHGTISCSLLWYNTETLNVTFNVLPWSPPFCLHDHQKKSTTRNYRQVAQFTEARTGGCNPIVTIAKVDLIRRPIADTGMPQFW